ncbi:MAG: TonB-dependent receptor, partial [Bacteroidetes bacterium]
MLRFLGCLFLVLGSIGSLVGQEQSFMVSGRVVEASSQLPIEFATVLITDPLTKASLAGTTTDVQGRFGLEVGQADFVLEVSFIGFQKATITEYEVRNGKVQLGDIALQINSQLLDEVTVRAEKSSTQFELDRRVFNVGKDLSSTGASVLEVLNNVPSVNVDIEGQISLRGSNGVQILINGKPSVLASEQGNALSTITAEMIDRIEVITNPSAKYEAEGTAGIINIVLKKDERKGLNGSATLNLGEPANHSFGLSLNRRTDHFNLFSQLGVGRRELPREVESINRNLLTGHAIASEGLEFRNESFFNLILGTDYHINDLNVLTLSGFFAYEIEDQPSETFFESIDANNDLTSAWRRTETTEATNPKWQYELQYKKDFEDSEDHVLLFSALGNFFGKEQSSDFLDVTLAGAPRDAEQETRTEFQEAINTFKLDYTKPFGEAFTLETGAQYVINEVSNDFAVSTLIGEEWVPDLSQTNIFEYDQKVFGLYSTGAYEGDQWGLKLGLRLEDTDLRTTLVTTQENNRQRFTNLFPSLHSSCKVTKAFSVQAGYSRRIFRPRLWDLNPFFNIRNNFNIRTGNPALLPEFTDSYELSSIWIQSKTTFNFTVYYRYTTDVVERLSTFEDGVTFTRPQNIGTNQSTGLEINGKYQPTRWLTFNGDLNYNSFRREGQWQDLNFDFAADQWSGKLTSKIKLPKDFDLEFTGHYRSAVETVQGRRAGNQWLDLGMRKKLLNGKGVINFSVRDLFVSRIEETFVNQPDFSVYNRR